MLSIIDTGIIERGWIKLDEQSNLLVIKQGYDEIPLLNIGEYTYTTISLTCGVQFHHKIDKECILLKGMLVEPAIILPIITVHQSYKNPQDKISFSEEFISNFKREILNLEGWYERKVLGGGPMTIIEEQEKKIHRFLLEYKDLDLATQNTNNEQVKKILIQNSTEWINYESLIWYQDQINSKDMAILLNISKKVAYILDLWIAFLINDMNLESKNQPEPNKYTLDTWFQRKDDGHKMLLTKEKFNAIEQDSKNLSNDVCKVVWAMAKNWNDKFDQEVITSKDIIFKKTIEQYKQ